MSVSQSVPLRASAFCLLFSAAPALADHTTPIIVTGIRDPGVRFAAEEVARTPGAATVVVADAYADRFASSLADTLRGVPGVFAQPRYGEEIRLSIRGSGIGRSAHLRGIALLLDGVPINLADGSGDFQEMDPTMLSHLDVRRGANALRYGAIGLGGAINAVSATARTVSHPFQARIEGGSFAAWRAHATGAVAGERTDFLIGVTGSSADGYRDQSQQFKIRFAANLGYRLSDTVETRAWLMLNHLDQDVPGSLTLQAAKRTPRAAAPGNEAQDYSRDIRSARLLSRTTVTLPSDARIEFGGYLNLKSLYHPIFQAIDQDSRDIGGFARIEGGTGAFDWLAGIEAQHGTIDAKQYLNVRGRRGSLTADADRRARTITGYGEARYHLTPKLALIGGVQWVHGRRAVEDKLQPGRSDSAHFSEVSPRAGLLWEPTAHVQLYANLSRAGELPTFSDLVQTGYSDSFIDLAPQRSWTAEIGSRGHSGGLRWDVSLYRSRLKGELLSFVLDPAKPAITYNAGRTIHQGIEASISARLLPHLELRGWYTLNDFRFADDAEYGDNRLPVVPVHQIGGEIAWTVGPVTLTPSLSWIPRGAWADYANSTRVSGYALLGLGTSIRLSERATLFAEGRNLTAERGIADIAATRQANPASAIYYPLEGRAFYGGLRFGL